jgi:hypothetical protein
VRRKKQAEVGSQVRSSGKAIRKIPGPFSLHRLRPSITEVAPLYIDRYERIIIGTGPGRGRWHRNWRCRGKKILLLERGGYF